jgi:hypothetical protein
LEVAGFTRLSQTYGNDIIIDGSFSTPGLPNWIRGVGWADGTGNATKNADGTGTLQQALSLVAGRAYKIIYTISSISGGSIQPYLNSGFKGVARSTPGTYTDYIIAVSPSTHLSFLPSATGVRAVIDTVSLVLESQHRYEWTAFGKTYRVEIDPAYPTYIRFTVDGAMASIEAASLEIPTFYLSSGTSTLGTYSAAEFARTGVYWTPVIQKVAGVVRGWFERLGVNSNNPTADLEVNNASGGKVRLSHNDFDGSAAVYCDLQVNSSGELLITPTGGKLDVNSNLFRLRTAKTPASAGDAGSQGDICWDANYIYVCVATNTWKRAALSSW